jgi:glycosyltransferase involved in cell wall biosynthesis
MKITIATNSLLPADKEGGPAYCSFYLAKALQAAGAEVRVVTTDRNGSERLAVTLDRWTEREGVPVFYASTGDGAWIRSRTYGSAINAAVERSDVCLMAGIFWNFTGLVAARACVRYRVPYVTLPHGLLSPWALRHKGLKKRVYWHVLAGRVVRRSAAMIALAQQELEDIRCIGLTVPAYIVPNGAFVEELASLETEDRSAGAAAEDRYILFLGRIHAKKGLDILLPAFERISQIDNALSLVIAGTVDEAYSRSFEDLLTANKARGRIRLVGNVSGADKARWLARASIFALTSYSEGLPVAVLEALSAGVPVVITPGCNLPEVAAAEAGIEVQPDVGSAAEALARLTSDALLRAKMGLNAKKLAHERFSWDGVARQVIDVCLSVTTKRPSSRNCQPDMEHDAAPR